MTKHAAQLTSVGGFAVATSVWDMAAPGKSWRIMPEWGEVLQILCDASSSFALDSDRIGVAANLSW